MAVGDCYSISVQALVDGNWAQNQILFEVANDPGLDPLKTATDLTVAYATATQTLWLACFSADYLLQGYATKRIYNGGGPTYLQATPGAIGAVTGVCDTSIIGGMIQGLYVDPLSGKYRNSKIFMPSAPSAYIQSSALQAAYLTALAALRVALSTTITGSAGGQYNWCAFKRKPSKHVLSFSDSRVSFHIGVQRKRARPEL